MRTIVDLPNDQIESLASICRDKGISRAEAVRRAVSAFIKQNETDIDDEAFGLWKGRKIDGVAHQRKLRREWLR